MEHIINQIREVLDEPLEKEGFSFDKKDNSYISILDSDKKIYSCFHFDIRRKSAYFLLKISIRIYHKEISEIINGVKIKAIENRDYIPSSLKKKLIKAFKGDPLIAGLYYLKELEIDNANQIDVWSCSIFDLTEIEDYKKQLISIFNSGLNWIDKCNNWDFLIDWTLNHNNALHSLAILKYLKREEEFESVKKKAIKNNLEKQLPIEELNIITYN